MSTPLDLFLQGEKQLAEKIFLRQSIGGAWDCRTWKQAGDEIRRMAAHLKSRGFPPGSSIAILSKNCAHWILADLAIWMAGHVSVPLYPTLAAEDIRPLLEHCSARALFAGKLDHYASQRDGIPSDTYRISFPGYGPADGADWNALIRDCAPLRDGEFTVSGDDLATIIYTSGTTGKPKGVMITFGALDFVAQSAIKELNIGPGEERFFSYLPLSHIAERMLVEMGALYSGASISFSESLETFAKDLAESHPTVFLAVPRIWSKFQEKVQAKIPQPKLELLLQIPLVRTWIRKKIRSALGLSDARWLFTGAAPMRTQLFEWFDRLGLVIHDVYGMTENLAYSHANIRRVKYGTAGHVWPCMEARFSDDGEVQVRHAGLMKGYYREPELTAEVFTSDGFLRSGDLGVMDADGFLRITGRMKDQFKTDKGKYIAPAPIELKLQKNHYIDHACIVGTGLPQPIALITLSSAARSRDRDEITRSLEQSLKELNPELQAYEKIEKAVVLNEKWTIDNGLITPTLKVKRNLVEQRHQSRYAEWFKSRDTVVWEKES